MQRFKYCQTLGLLSRKKLYFRKSFNENELANI